MSEGQGLGDTACSAAQPVGFDASEFHTFQTLVLQLQVIGTLEEVAVTWEGKEGRLSPPRPETQKVPGSFERHPP